MDSDTGGRVIYHGYLLPDAITEIQRDADILLLPLAFDAPTPEIIRSAATTKLSEYLVSGRPLLVHAPRDSYVASIARDHGFAEVVDEPSEDALGDAIYRLIHEPARRARIVAAAREYALHHYSTSASVDTFVDAVNGMIE
jgi:glycosyltransferase involved in cell wall biosynthesis